MVHTAVFDALNGYRQRYEPYHVTARAPLFASRRAAAAVLARLAGTDAVPFSTTSEGLPGVTRSFASFSDAAAEAGLSRIYGGIHWQYDNVDALAVGTALGTHVVDGFLRPRCASE